MKMFNLQFWLFILVANGWIYTAIEQGNKLLLIPALFAVIMSVVSLLNNRK